MFRVLFRTLWWKGGGGHYQCVVKLAHFDGERIPELAVHAHGASAKGFFEVGLQTCGAA